MDKRREIKVLAILVLIAVLISIGLHRYLFRLKALFEWGININIYDTYFVIESVNSFFGLTAILFFLLFLPLIYFYKYQSYVANIIFLISNLYLIYLLTFLIIAISKVSGQLPVSGGEEGFTVYAPPSDVDNTNRINVFGNISIFLMAFQFCLILIFGYVLFKIGYNMKCKSMLSK